MPKNSPTCLQAWDSGLSQSMKTTNRLCCYTTKASYNPKFLSMINQEVEFTNLLQDKFGDEHLNTDSIQTHVEADTIEVNGFKFFWDGQDYDLQLRYLQEIGEELTKNWNFYIVDGEERTPVYQSDMPEKAKGYLAEKITYNRDELRNFEP